MTNHNNAAQADRHLEPCPFCGRDLHAQWDRNNPKARCRTDGCKGSQLPVLNLDVPGDIVAWNTRALLSKLRAPVADERISLRGAANLAFNALHECKPVKGAERQYSDAIQALQSALHDIAYTVNRTATPQQFADHLQREARAALASAPVAGDAQPGALQEAQRLARNLFQRHYAQEEDYASGRVKWQVLDDLPGVLSQIDNMVSGLAQLTPAPVADERTAFEAAIHDEYGTSAASMLLRDADGDYVTMNTEWVFWLKRAALASAPVAGEAQPKSYRDSEHFHKTASIAELGAWQRGWNDCRESDAAPQSSEAVRDGKWPMLSELHLHALMFAYNEGYSKAYDGRVFPNPFSENGSQAAAWQLGTDDGTEARAALSAQPGAQRTGGSDE